MCADSSPDTSDDTPTTFTPRLDRSSVEHVGLAFVAVLALVMLTFLLLYALRAFPVADGLYSNFMIGGQWLDWFFGTNVFRHPFMWHSLATGVLIGIAAPLIGSFLVHREMALIGETLAHTAFAGVAVGVLFAGVSGWRTGSVLLLAALVVAVIGALGVQWLARHTTSYGDVPIAIMLSGSFAIGTLLISYGRGRMAIAIDIEAYLFGNIAIVTAGGAQLMAAIACLTVGVVAYAYRPLLFITFDERAAQVARINVTWYNTVLIVTTAVVVVGALQILGVILVAAMLVVPVAAASQVARSFRETIVLGVLFGEAAVLAGFAVSIGLSLPSGGSIVVVAIGIYLLAIGAARAKGRTVASMRVSQ